MNEFIRVCRGICCGASLNCSGRKTGIIVAVFFCMLNCVGSGADFGFDPTKNPSMACQMYLAPESFLFYRLRFPDGRILLLEKNFEKKGELMGIGGWSGFVNGGNALVKAPPPNDSTSIAFNNGKPISASRGTMKKDLKQDWVTPHLGYEESPLFECMADIPPSPANPDGYWQDGRLTFPYENPNRSALLYAGLGVLALWLLMIPRRIACVAGLTLSALCLALLFWTASRGGLLAFFFGAGVVVFSRFIEFFRRKSVWICLMLVFAAIGIWFTVAPPKLVTRGSEQNANGWSNRIRVELWQAAPRMMVDAPEGWKISPPGPAYVDWYQPFNKIVYACTLINDHLTRMASYGWYMRFIYVFAWVFVLSLTGWFAIKTRNAVPFGCWSVIAIAAWFNPVTVGKWSVFVWLPAVVASSALIMSCAWLRRVSILICMLFSALSASFAVASIYSYGKSSARAIPSIHTEGRHVVIGGANPTVWVVDDGFALGGLMFGRDIRDYYHKNPCGDPIGYVKNVEDLPSSGIRRLVLAGRAGDDFLRKTCSDAAGPRGIPPEIVFLSPPFPPQAIPKAVWARSEVTMYIGEFATWYSSEYNDVPSWVKIIPGTVRYFPGWMYYAIGEQAKSPRPNQFL